MSGIPPGISPSLNTLPPQTRAILSQSPRGPSSSLPSGPSSPISTSSSGHGYHTSYPDRDDTSFLTPGKGPRPGASLINMHAVSRELPQPPVSAGNNSTSAGLRIRNVRGGSGSGSGSGSGEHVSQGDDYEDQRYPHPPPSSALPATPSGFAGNSGYGYGSQRVPPAQLSSSQLRTLRTQAGLVDPYSPAGGLHTLHSKGSNLSTSTFMPKSNRRTAADGEDGDESIKSPLTPTPGANTPSRAGDLTPFTPYSAGQTGSATHLPSQTGSKSERDSTPKASHQTPERPESTATTSAVPSRESKEVRSKSSMATTTTAAGSRVSRGEGRADKENRGDRERDRERRREREHKREAEGDGTTGSGSRRVKIRTIPHLPHGAADVASSTVMYWSRAPVYGHLPTRAMRAHSVTLVDNTAWLFGGCDERGCARDVWCCDVETFQWTHPPLTGDIPPPCRAHTATLVDGKRIFIFGGGEGPTYYNSLYILDTQTRRFTWVPCGQKPAGTGAQPGAPVPSATEPSSSDPSSVSTPQSVNPPLPSSSVSSIPQANGSTTSIPHSATIHNANIQGGAMNGKDNKEVPIPLPRRAHTTVLYRNKLYIFGGGNGVKALNDVWSLDTSVPVEKMRWEQIKTVGPKPGPRGYHTANLVGNIMIVVGGSDGRECFSDIWVLNLDTLIWTLIDTDKEYKRLSHSSTQVGSYLFIMGGHDGLKYSSELLLFNLVTLQYEHKLTLGRPPPARGYHISLLADARLLVFGGFDGHSVYDDVWLLDLAGAAYLPQVTSFALLIDGGH